MSSPYSFVSSVLGQKHFFSMTVIPKKKNHLCTAWVGFLLSSLLLVPSFHYPLSACYISSAVHPGKDVWILSWAARTAPQVTCIQRSSRASLHIKVNQWVLWNKPSPFYAYSGQHCNNFYRFFNDFDLQKEKENPGRRNQSYTQKFFAIPGVAWIYHIFQNLEWKLLLKKLDFFSPLWKFVVLHVDLKVFDEKKEAKYCRLFILGSQGFENSIATELLQLVAWLQEAEPLLG